MLRYGGLYGRGGNPSSVAVNRGKTNRFSRSTSRNNISVVEGFGVCTGQTVELLTRTHTNVVMVVEIDEND